MKYEPLKKNILYQWKRLWKGVPMAQLVKITDKSQKTIKARLESMPKEHLLITTVNRVKYYKLNLLMFK